MLLALHTTSRGCHVAALHADGSLKTATAPQASSALPSLALELTVELDGSPFAPDAIAVACGPGSFTGIKIGLASAWGLARPRRIPVLGVGSLDALVVAGRRQAGAVAGAAVAVCGAYATFVYAARFRCGIAPEDVELEDEYLVGKPGEVLPPILKDSAAVFVEGTPLTDIAAPALAADSIVRVEPGVALAEAVARIAKSRDARSLRQQARALYLRADPAKAW